MAEFHERNDWDEDEATPPPPPWWRSRKMVYAGIGAAGVLGLVFAQGRVSHHQKTETSQQTAIGAVVPYQPAQAAPPPAPPPPSPAPPPPLAIPTFQAELSAAKPHRQPAMLSYVVKSDPPAAAAKDPPEAKKTKVEFETAKLPGMKASPAIDETYVLEPGLLSCVLDTAIQSDLPGPLLCHLPGPVYSPKGVLLMEAGTQVIGQYKSMENNGANRLLAVSTFAHTPNGVWVPLTAQPLADDLGRSGLDGSVDHRYFEKFGGAILLDLSQSGLQIVQAKVAQGGNTYLNLGSSYGLASQILNSTINLPPLFSKHQGETIALWLTEPIDFSDSYRVRAAR